MRRILRFGTGSLSLLWSLSVAQAAFAQDAPPTPTTGSSSSTPGDAGAPKTEPGDPSTAPDPSAIPDPPKPGATPPTGDETTKARTKTAQDAKESLDADDMALDPIETDDEERKARETKWYLGARFRNHIIPGFFFDIFADGGPGAVNVFSFGPEMTMHSKGLEIIFSANYADYSMDPFVFKSKEDPERAYELVSSTLKLFGAQVDILGNIPLDKKGSVSLLIGGDVGISGVVGDLNRNQVYPNDPDNIDPGDSNAWTRCAAPGDVNGVIGDQNFCDASNEHYGNYSEPSWANGGSKPFIWPTISLPHIALRVAPVEEFQVRLDTGFGLTGFFFGLGAGGKLPL
jgi:hypothetical protein